jgi:hypothetical protein
VATADKNGSIAELCEGVNSLVEAMAAIIGQIKFAADTIAVGATEIAQGNSDLAAHRAAGASLEETAVSMRACEDPCSAPPPTHARPASWPVARPTSLREAARGARGGETMAVIKRVLADASSTSSGDRWHRLPDQHPGAERRGGSGACG